MRYSMMLVASRIAAILLATTFVAAGAATLLRYGRWRSALDEYNLPREVSRSIAAGVPVAELVVAGVLIALSQRIGAATSLVLLALFSAAIARVAVIRGRRVPCGCFGGDRSRDYRLLLARTGVLCAAAGVVLAAGAEGPIVDSVRAADLVPMSLVIAGIALMVWLGAQMSGSLRGRPR